MDTQTYLIFELNRLQYGLHTDQVREIFQLPKVIPIADAPGDIIGILNFRGKVLPIMHLAKRLGQDMPTCQLSDSVIVVEWQGMQIGMVVNRVHDVQSFHADSIEAAPTYERRNHMHTAFASGIAKIDGQLITLLNPEALIRQTDDVVRMAGDAKFNDDGGIVAHSHGVETIGDEKLKESMADFADAAFSADRRSELSDFFSLYCPQATPAQKQLFQQRAIDLQSALESSNISRLKAVAVIRLGEEYFGIELPQVREFINTQQVMSIPCCPTHILGNMNLRGDVMTLVDIRGTLNLPEPKEQSAKAVIVETDDLVAGIMVDQVLDVVYLQPSEIASMPAAIPKHRQDFFQGANHYSQKTLSILNLSKIFEKGELIVDHAA